MADNGFRSAFRALEVASVRRQFPNLITFESDFDLKPDWPYLLFCASALAPSEFAAAEEIALRISYCALQDDQCTRNERDAALVVLDSLSNRRTISLAVERGCAAPHVEARLGTVQGIDWARRSFENRIDLVGGNRIFANRFQRRFWAAAEQSQWLSMSAPTSAGKSFILTQWIVDRIARDEISRVVYIAPTRALVQQVETDLRAIVSSSGYDDIDLRSLPHSSGATISNREVLIFTQERLHYYLQKFGPLGIDALVIDEAHKVGDSSRGILLEDVIEQVASANPGLRVIFTSPLTENPEVLLSDAPDDASKGPLRSDDATVNQNLLWIARASDDRKGWILSLRKEDKSIPIGRFQAKTSLSGVTDRIAELAILSDTGEGGILIYADGAASAEGLAENIAKRLDAVERSEAIEALDALCEDTIHRDFKLRSVLQKGVAFHYGNMPLLLRTAIEDLFRDGSIKYLVCTSTLVEGVNLPCRSIVVRAPRKGKKDRMTPADFWNLAGRAGRWGKEFQGNVICIDTDDADAWGDTLPRQRGRYKIERTTDRLLKDDDRLIEYIASGAPSGLADKNKDLESAVSYFAAVRNANGSLVDAPWRNRADKVTLARVDAALGEAIAGIEQVPAEWLRRHAGISPFAMSRMIGALTKLEEIERFLPVDPEDPEASKVYARIFEMMSYHMTTAFGSGARCVSLGILTTNWMLGYPIKRLIADRIKNLRKRDKLDSLAKIIRNTLEDVEQIARFQAPRYLACYSDIARLVLMRRDEEVLVSQIPDLTLRLEFGVRGPVQLALMSLGLSRSSTLAVSAAVASRLAEAEIIHAQSNPAPIIAAMRDLEVDALGLSGLIMTEIENFQRLLAAGAR